MITIEKNRFMITPLQGFNNVVDTLLHRALPDVKGYRPFRADPKIGLSLSYDMIKAHGGEISVNSKKGEGTEFVVMLPIG